MSHFTQNSPEERAQLANQIAARLGRVPSMAIRADVSVELGEDLETWILLPEALTNPGRRISEVARQGRFWHHLLRHGGQPARVAASEWEERGGTRRLHAIFQPTFIGGLADAMAWIDSNDTSQDVARLLIFPPWRIYSIWLQGADSDRLVVAECPTPSARLELRRYYSGPDFLRALAAIPGPKMTLPQGIEFRTPPIPGTPF